MARRLQITVHGRVQGVAYRYSVREEAERLGLRGWARNLPDGSVEVCAEGDEPALRDLLAWCRRGPPAARVDSVTEGWAEATGEFSAFEILH